MNTAVIDLKNAQEIRIFTGVHRLNLRANGQAQNVTITIPLGREPHGGVPAVMLAPTGFYNGQVAYELKVDFLDYQCRIDGQNLVITLSVDLGRDCDNFLYGIAYQVTVPY